MSLKSRKQIVLYCTIFLMLFLGSCGKNEDYRVTNLNHNTLMILGHRGMGEYFPYPGNTLEAILPVLEIGADGSEIDIQMTKDSVLVLFHGDNLKLRTYCSGEIYHYNWDEINGCNYTARQPDVKLISLEELFSHIDNLTEYYFSFDCKLNSEFAYDDAYRSTFLRAIKRICDHYQMGKNVFIEGDMGFLLMARKLGLENKGFVIGSSVNDAIKNNIFGIGASVETPADTIDYAHENGIYVMMWGAKSDIGNKQALKLNPDILQTDKPIPLLMLLDRMNHE